jgi:hypothetical protein
MRSERGLENLRNKMLVKAQEILMNRCYYWVCEGWSLGSQDRVLPGFDDWKLHFVNKSRFSFASKLNSVASNDLASAYYELFVEGYNRGKNREIKPLLSEIKDRYTEAGK